jgi:hypothetical protein
VVLVAAAFLPAAGAAGKGLLRPIEQCARRPRQTCLQGPWAREESLVRVLGAC